VQPQNDGLASYRRLIELQKQMIELSQKHELSKRECNALREQVAREVAQRLHNRRTWRRRMQQSARRILQRVPGFASVEMNFSETNHRGVLPC
jgi:ribosomal protein S3